MTTLDRAAVDALLARARREIDDGRTGLSFCYLTNGRDLNILREHRRTTAMASYAAVCAV